MHWKWEEVLLWYPDQRGGDYCFARAERLGGGGGRVTILVPFGSEALKCSLESKFLQDQVDQLVCYVLDQAFCSVRSFLLLCFFFCSEVGEVAFTVQVIYCIVFSHLCITRGGAGVY